VRGLTLGAVRGLRKARMADVRITAAQELRRGAAVRGVDLQIRDGEFCVLVGPPAVARARSCGPSPAWRARQAAPSRSAARWSTTSARATRDVAMVFQDYALYPHMNVARNIGFGLKARKFPSRRLKNG
jgi:multiple sugar transport system ATP-binding protein